MTIGCAYRDDVGVVSRRVDSGVPVCIWPVILSLVAGRHDNDDSSLPCGFHSLAERILGVGFVDSAAQRKVQDADVVSALK